MSQTMATLRRMFQTPRSCSASAVSSTSSHSHLLLFCFSQTKLLQYFFFHLGAWLWNFLRFCLPENVFILPSSLVDSLARCRILCSKSGVGKLWPTGQTQPFTCVGKWRFAETQPCSFLYRRYTCFCATLAELNSYKKDHLTHKMWNIYSFLLKEKCVYPYLKSL